MAASTEQANLRRTFNAQSLNELANHPNIRPQLGGDGRSLVTFDSEAAYPLNHLLEFKPGGAFFLLDLEPGIYGAHSLFLPEFRGEFVIDAMRQARRYMFVETDCVEIQTQVPTGNVAALALTKRAGFRETFRQSNVWPEPGGGHGVAYFALTLDEWAMHADECREAGEAFHRDLAAAVGQLGQMLPPHIDDGGAHDRAAGAAYLMCRAGNAAKGIAFYNRWARQTRNPTLQLLSETPLVVDIHDAVVTLRDGQMLALSASVESRRGGLTCHS